MPTDGVDLKIRATKKGFVFTVDFDHSNELFIDANEMAPIGYQSAELGMPIRNGIGFGDASRVVPMRFFQIHPYPCPDRARRRNDTRHASWPY